MSEESFLSDDFLRQLIGVGGVDLMVGVPSHNDAKTVVPVLRAIEEGVLRNYRRERIVLLNVDAGSRDGTQEALLEASSLGKANGFESLRTLRWITTRAGHERDSGSTLRTILAAADLLQARGCAIISAASTNATPAWVDTLLRPIYRDNFDFVGPMYSRHKFDGLLTRNLLYPISKALFGKPLRELRAPDFAFSGGFASYCLAQQQWHYEAVRDAAEMWMAVNAMSNSFRCCQTYLGNKLQSGGGAGVVAAIRQTLSGLFWCMEASESYWRGTVDSALLETIGPDHDLTSENVRVDRNKLLAMFKSGVNELSGLLSQILQPDTHAELQCLTGAESSECSLSNSLWARIVYEFAAGYHHSVMNREHLVQALVPIYRGRVYSFVTQHRMSSPDAMEADLEDLCREFAKQKAYLIERWKTNEEEA